MSTVSENLLFASSHEWVRQIDDNTIEVGISDYAQEALGDVVYVELPEVGSHVQKAQECCAVESVKAASDIYAPASGEVIEVNEALDDTPELLNESPFENGWMFRIALSDSSELQELLDEARYRAQLD